MIPAPIATDEQDRLADLRALKLLNTPREERFERIVQLAAQVLNVPIAYIALIDSDRQWFKAKCGLTTDETGRDISFCGHAIQQDEPLIVPDARLDPRFHDNPLVTGEPFVRFYAGHPLDGPSGFHIGTFCIASPEPREASPAELDLFVRFARLAQHELEMLDVIEAQRELLATRRALAASQKALALELKQAEEYVRGLLPLRLKGNVATDWWYQPSSQLGGDLFGYHWLTGDRLAMYLFDVAGHGVGAALMSSAIAEPLRRQSLPGCDFNQPDRVLAALNRAFPMEEHAGRFFTIWYGVYDVPSRVLSYSTAGHPPAILIDPAGSSTRIGQPGLLVGVDVDATYDVCRHEIAPGSRLYLYSDGVTEATRDDGQLVGMEGLEALLRGASAARSRVEQVYRQITATTNGAALDDDFSLLELAFS
ncbi:MAG: GAF domain-containing SpoIIE family protein phosphatase [Pirellulaceae bacterium]